MDYQKHYYLLVERARHRILEGYSERHHIIPKCIGGTDESSNLVNLTPEEHFVSHQLLVKIYPEHKNLIFAAKMMTVGNNYIVRNNKLFGWIKRKDSEVRTGVKNPRWSEYLKGNTFGKANKGKKNPSLAARNIGNSYALGKTNHGAAARGKIAMLGNTYGTALKGRKNPGVSEANLLRMVTGNHPSQKKQKCEHCNKEISIGMYVRWHGDRCKHRRINNL